MRPDDAASDGVPPNLRGLRVYQEAQACAGAVAAHVAGFPLQERYALADQMRRASSSVYANIAEGHSRTSRREQARYYEMSRSSLVELTAHIDHATSRALLSLVATTDLRQRMLFVGLLLAGLIRATKSNGGDRDEAR
jgi:four helix bundle protein